MDVHDDAGAYTNKKFYHHIARYVYLYTYVDVDIVVVYILNIL